MECRNCGAASLEDLGAIGRVAPFFLKRVLGLEVKPATPGTWKQKVRDILMGRTILSRVPKKLRTKLTSDFAFAEMQLCSVCSFIQTNRSFHDDDIMRLYLDYRSDSYNQERSMYEPWYATVASAVGQDRTEIENRTRALTDFLNRNLPSKQSLKILDYGGADGRFLPNIPAEKYVFEVSDIAPVPGVTRVNSEAELKQYSLVLLSHVIEHVTHPLDLARKVLSYVEPGGYLYLETPQEISDPDRDRLRHGAYRRDIIVHEHINSYCPTAVRHLLESAGTEFVAIESTPVEVGWAKAIHIRALGKRKSDIHPG